jgi:hypothetical protein
MIRKQAYILIGDDMTGKTTFQKYLILHLCGVDKFNRLYTNLIHHINHPESPKKLGTLFTINRSIQEKMGEYKSVDNYFNDYFKDADICVLSSHTHDESINEIIQMMSFLRERYYNVEAIFFSNHLNSLTSQISKLDWDQRLIIDNPFNPENWESQIDDGARKFAESLIRTSKLY